MGGASFAREREVNDAEIAAKYGVPEAMVAYRRSLDDLDLIAGYSNSRSESHGRRLDG